MSGMIRAIVAGAGIRGFCYSQFAKLHPDKLKIVGVAEPRQYYREQMAREFQIPPEHVYDCWTKMAAAPKFADAVFVTTQDRMHVAPAVAFADKGYHLLLEKPMAPDIEGCKQITDAALNNDVILCVCHVLRYTEYTKMLKSVLNDGKIGRVMSIQHLEPVGYWHHAHSYVRGNWSNEKESSNMLLAKSCHDLDWLRYIADSKCTKINSFGRLSFFTSENKPHGAGQRCVKCAVENECPYSAVKIYLGRAKRKQFGWPVSVLTSKLDEAGVSEAITNGKYGKCVFSCDNDVVDHQVVNMEFENGVTAAFTMTAFTQSSHRQTTIFGTHGQLFCDGNNIRIYNFLTDQTENISVNDKEGSLNDGHGGGDYNIVKDFVAAISGNDPSQICSGAEESLETHLMVFAAEVSRLNDTVEQPINYLLPQWSRAE